jgi:hypothetical protein
MRKLLSYFLFAMFLMVPLGVRAQTVATTSPAPPPTSREIPFDLVFSHLPFGSTQSITVEVWDAQTGGNLIFSEAYPNVKIGFLGELDFVLGSQTPGGIPTNDFPSGASRYVDVVDTANRSVLVNGRIPLYANAFALTPGLAGPQGAPGPAGQQGPSGANGLNGATGPQGPQGLVGTAGPMGPQGPLGLQGPPGAPGQQGATGINNKGSWIGTTAYNPSDSVFDAGSYWLATAANTNSEPSPVNTNWQLLAAGINNRGAWIASSSYNINDAATDQGSFWLALGGNSNSEPSLTNTNWLQLASSGTPGTPGTPGAQGNPGPIGPPGPAGAAGVAGPPGPQGPPGPGGFTAMQEFTQSGNFTVPAGVTHIWFQLWGAGGGGGATLDGSLLLAGGGGGGGAYSSAILGVFPGQVLTINVGAGGAGGTANGHRNDQRGGAVGDVTDVVFVDAHSLLLLAQGGGGATSSLNGPALGGIGGTADQVHAQISHTGANGANGTMGTGTTNGSGAGAAGYALSAFPFQASQIGGGGAGGSAQGPPFDGSSGQPGYALLMW